MIKTADSNNATNRYQIFNASQPSLWNEEVQAEGSRQQELVGTLSTWAVLNGYPELASVGVKPGRSNWTIDTWDLPRLETVHEAADLFSQRHRAYFALSHWAIMHGHPCVACRVGDETLVIEPGLTSWVAWCKDASLEDLQQALETVNEEDEE